MKLIDKDAIVAEIERRLEKIANASSENNRELSTIPGAQQYELISLVQYINTLEVKEVDINNEIAQFIDTNFEKATIGHRLSLKRTAKHFFELGLNAKMGGEENTIDEEYKIGKWFTGLIPCWINAPSTLQPAHSYHGKNVIAIHLKGGGYKCCCIDDIKPVVFTLAENTRLEEGWHNREFKE